MSTFHPFPKLPLELRLAIWEMTVEPREVEVRIVQPMPEDPIEAKYWNSHPDEWASVDAEKFDKAMTHAPTSKRGYRKAKTKLRQEWKPYRPYVHMVSSMIPPALHTCRDARNHLIRSDHGLYQPISLHADAQPADRRYVWLNLDIDLVNIGTSYLNHFEPIAPAIKRLKLSRENTLGNFWYKVEGQYLLPLFFNVEKMYVVCIDSIINWSNDDVYLYSWPCAKENLVFIDEISPLGYIEAGYLELDGYVERLHDFKKDKNELY
jgi:hypothetical protein